MAKTQYTADSITVLEGLDAVRKRPGMYIGGVGQKALNHLIYEIMDNAIDEHLAGYCSEVHIVLEKDGSCTVRDNGRGIPVELHRKGVSAERVVMTTLHAGGKFDNNAYKTSGGLHGVGSSVVNALSKRMRVRISRGGVVYEDSYAKGVPTTELKNGLLPIVGKKAESGTEINFLPDPEIFEKTHFRADWLKSRLHETAYLNPGITIYYENKLPGEEEQEVFREPEGLIAYVRALNEGQTASRSISRAALRTLNLSAQSSLWMRSRRSCSASATAFTPPRAARTCRALRHALLSSSTATRANSGF